MRHQTTSPLSRVGPTASLRDAEPDFLGPIENVTVPLGREAVLTCSVSDIGDYKVRAKLRDTICKDIYLLETQQHGYIQKVYC